MHKKSGIEIEVLPANEGDCILIKAVKEDLNEMRQAYVEYFPEDEKVEIPQE